MNDFNSLVRNRNRNETIKLNNKYAYKVVATDEEIESGTVLIQLRNINADKSTKPSGRTITIDIETQEEKEKREQLEEQKKLDNAYAEKHGFRNWIGITREEFEKNNDRDY